MTKRKLELSHDEIELIEHTLETSIYSLEKCLKIYVKEIGFTNQSTIKEIRKRKELLNEIQEGEKDA